MFQEFYGFSVTPFGRGLASSKLFTSRGQEELKASATLTLSLLARMLFMAFSRSKSGVRGFLAKMCRHEYLARYPLTCAVFVL